MHFSCNRFLTERSCKTAVAFGMYDLDKDGFISLDDLTEILQHTTKGHSDPLRVKMIAASLLQVSSCLCDMANLSCVASCFA